MPYDATIYRILLASPSDLKEELAAFKEVIYDWNNAHSYHTKMMLEPASWGSHGAPGMGADPQAIINKKVVDTCDLLVGAFWTRIGTPTPRSISGTVEEIEKFLKAGKPVFVYFSDTPISPGDINLEQLQKLREYKNGTYPNGLFFNYKDIEKLKKCFRQHLENQMHEFEKAANKDVQHETIVEASSIQNVEPTKEIVSEADIVKSGFNKLIRGASFQWSSIRDLDGKNLYEARHIIVGLKSALSELRRVVIIDKEITDEDSEFDKHIKSCIKQLGDLLADPTYMISPGSTLFWSKGDYLLTEIKKIPELL